MASGASGGMGAIVADLGANLVAVLVILVAVASLGQTRNPQQTPSVAAAVDAAPLSGRDQSDLLYLRLRPDPGVLTIELTDGGAFVPKGGVLLPLDRLPPPWPPRAAVYVFSPRHYATLRALAEARALAMQEITVPDALRRTPPVALASGFSTAFLALPTTADPASIRPALLRLLTAGPGSAALDDASASDGLASRIARSLRPVLNLCLFVSGLALLRRLRRATNSAAAARAPTAPSSRHAFLR